MRLNFSGSHEDEIREGIRRIGRVIAEQVELFESITGEHRVVDEPPDSEPGDVLPFRR
jgi:2-aminoadipate transaminase